MKMTTKRLQKLNKKLINSQVKIIGRNKEGLFTINALIFKSDSIVVTVTNNKSKLLEYVFIQAIVNEIKLASKVRNKHNRDMKTRFAKNILNKVKAAKVRKRKFKYFYNKEENIIYEIKKGTNRNVINNKMKAINKKEFKIICTTLKPQFKNIK